MSTFRNLIVGALAYAIAHFANPDASDWQTLAITGAIIFLMFINDLWRYTSGD